LTGREFTIRDEEGEDVIVKTLPNLKLALKEGWPTGWIQPPFSVNDVNVTFVKPRIDTQTLGGTCGG
jgi:hypothetical protein